ncbi:unnamed protein product [Nippostrongylus brasiliensis]|uniref:Secreted protein n=1 Tax=Nippostrongylus brasiliensis TaxID=27835 RepID=A0A0N4XTF6_NIPBR|nr:unnamed protein product [Nippostrongylus brasiliensis]
MLHLLFTVTILFSVNFASSVAHPPKLELAESPVLFGTIHGSPVIAVYHGSTDVLKEDIQNKDTEDDPLSKMGTLLE